MYIQLQILSTKVIKRLINSDAGLSLSTFNAVRVIEVFLIMSVFYLSMGDYYGKKFLKRKIELFVLIRAE